MENNEALHVIPTLIPFVLVIFMIAMGVVLLNFQFRKNLLKKQLEREELKRKHQQKLLETSISIQEEERKRIALDLHDEVGALLSIGKMHLSNLNQKTSTFERNVNDVKELLEMALDSTRQISRKLMPIQLEKLGFKKTLLSFAHSATESSDVEVVLSIQLNEVDLSSSLQLGLYRIFSELVNNSLKYANASKITAEINGGVQGGSMIYSDDGKGIDFENFESGLGILSIDNRIEYLNGQWRYGNTDKGGFCAEIIVPFSN